MEQRRDQQGRRPDQQQQAQQGTRQQQGGQSDARQPQQQDRQGVSGLGDSDKARGMGQQGGGQQGGGAGRGQEHQQDMQRGQQGRQQGGGQAGSGQQQQFDPQGSGQQGGGGTHSRFADQIRENMEVIDDRGQRCGTVDHIDGDRIKLARSDSPDGQHHYIPLSQVAGIEGNKVRLRERGDNDFGMETRS